MNAFSVSVDYLTITAPLMSPQDLAIQAVYDAWVFFASLNGHEESAARRLGYVGNQMGTVFLGGRSDSRMITASGAAAHWIFYKMMENPLQVHVTRIDLQCTWMYEHDDERLAVFLCDQVRAYQLEKAMPNPPKITLIQGFGKGDTLMVGTRSSEKYIRVYDKTREQHEQGPPWLWRWEAELKGSTALQVYAYLSSQNGTAKSILEALTTFLDSRGIMHPWREITEFLEPKAERSETTYEKSLSWLRSHVRSTVRKLLQAGYADDVADALGLDTVGEDGKST